MIALQKLKGWVSVARIYGSVEQSRIKYEASCNKSGNSQH
jgi:hypothetical protein